MLHVHSWAEEEKKKKYCEASAIKPRWDQTVVLNSGTANNLLSDLSWNNERVLLTDGSYDLIVPLFLFCRSHDTPCSHHTEFCQRCRLKCQIRKFQWNNMVATLWGSWRLLLRAFPFWASRGQSSSLCQQWPSSVAGVRHWSVRKKLSTKDAGKEEICHSYCIWNLPVYKETDTCVQNSILWLSFTKYNTMTCVSVFVYFKIMSAWLTVNKHGSKPSLWQEPALKLSWAGDFKLFKNAKNTFLQVMIFVNLSWPNY